MTRRSFFPSILSLALAPFCKPPVAQVKPKKMVQFTIYPNPMCDIPKEIWQMPQYIRDEWFRVRNLGFATNKENK